MNQALLDNLAAAQQELEPQFKALRMATGALKRAVKLARADKADALAMQKALVKLEQALELAPSETLQTATKAFAADTQKALDALAFEFARDLKEVFEQRGERVEGRPPTLVVGELVLQIDIAARKAQWFYGKEALTRPIPLSIDAIIKAYYRQQKAIVQRTIDVQAFIEDLHKAWQDLRDERKYPPRRLNIVATYNKLVINLQTKRFWNNPSRRTFKDYERPHFVRDLVLAQAAPTAEINGQTYHLRLAVATKSQAGSAQRSIWLPNGPLDGEYYSDITFEVVDQ